MPQVRVILGSKTDMEYGERIREMLDKFDVDYDFYISSAHRNPERTANLAKFAEKDGVRVIIGAAGMAAHLPGVLAAQTTLPVIGVPLSGSALNGVDALYSVVQMPTGIPVASVAINGTRNAALLAVQILALSDENLKHRLEQYREELSLQD
jgi:5-(carboxyamino)imidazole ribonucleotide mutase